MKIVTNSKVELVSHYGDDLLVVNAARVSFDKFHDEFGGNDAGLIRYLAKHDHFMPFCHPHVTFRVHAPIFVARQLMKHQIGLSWSEVSRRYVDEEPTFYFPDVWRSRPDGSIKQGSGAEHPASGVFGTAAMFNVGALVNLYNQMIDDGIAPEQARMILPQSMMTTWIWTGSMLAFNRVCKLRLDSHAQEETRDVAEQINRVCEELFPISWMELMRSGK